jgi:hypothetical protein
MKGIYLTQEGKQELEAKIAERRKYSPIETEDDWFENGELNVYKEILSSATILSVEESWSDMQILNNDNLEYVKSKFANGVIIQPKQ